MKPCSRRSEDSRLKTDSNKADQTSPGEIMDIIRLCAWGYAALLGFVILSGYIPAFIDANDMIFGLIRRTWYADGLLLVSELWVAAGALTTRRAYVLYIQLFGVLHFH